MTAQEIVNQYRSGCLSNQELHHSFCGSIQSIFQVSDLMKGLDMTWTLGCREGVIATIAVPHPMAEKMFQVKCIVDAQDSSQLPLEYLERGKLTEEEELRIFFDLLGENGVFVDIGANAGWYSILAALNGAAVYAFEPLPATYQRLTKNIALNDISRIKTFPVGLGEKSSTEIFYYHPYISGASSRANLDYFSDGSAKTEECPLTTLDHIAATEQIDRIDLIKCDIEGAELFAFRGAKETIKRLRPFVLSEMLRKWSAKFGYHPDEIINFFADLEYICVALYREHPGEGYILEHMLETTAETNFLFIPKEKIPVVQGILKF